MCSVVNHSKESWTHEILRPDPEAPETDALPLLDKNFHHSRFKSSRMRWGTAGRKYKVSVLYVKINGHINVNK